VRDMTYDNCSRCAGHGLVAADHTGEPTDCSVCDGTGLVQYRDKFGRFAKKCITYKSLSHLVSDI
jgi:DnaJ-class molecular chaperone